MKSLSHVRLLATPWTAAYQAPLSMGFSRQEYWSGVPLPSLDCSLLLCKGKVTHSSDKPSLQCALCTLASLLCWYDCEPRVRASRAPSGCSDGPQGFAVPDAPGMHSLHVHHCASRQTADLASTYTLHPATGVVVSTITRFNPIDLS